MNNIINLTSISKSYDLIKASSNLILKDLSLEINKSSNITIVGKSGAGKTSLLKIIGLIDQEYSGTYILDGADVSTLNRKRIANLRNNLFGFVFQDLYLVKNETGFDNILLPLLYSKKFNKKEQLERINFFAKKFNVKNVLDKKVKEMSGGEQQRIALIRAVINDPDIIIMDEPTSHMNKELKMEVIDFINEMKDKIFIIATHDNEVIYEIKSTLYELSDSALILRSSN